MAKNKYKITPPKLLILVDTQTDYRPSDEAKTKCKEVKLLDKPPTDKEAAKTAPFSQVNLGIKSRSEGESGV